MGRHYDDMRSRSMQRGTREGSTRSQRGTLVASAVSYQREIKSVDENENRLKPARGCTRFVAAENRQLPDN